MPFSIPDIMALEEVRTANEAGRAVLVLSRDLETLLFANRSATVFTGWEADSADDVVAAAPLWRQLRPVASVVAEDGEAMLRLKVRREDLELWVTAHLLAIDGPADGPIVVLTAPIPGTGREDIRALASRLHSEAELPDASVFMLNRPEPVAGDASLRLAEGAASRFLDSGAGQAETADGFFWRVASELLLAVPAPAEQAPQSAGHRSEMGALVERWRSRDGARGPSPSPEAERGPVPVRVAAANDAGPVPRPVAFEAALDSEPVRFVWRIDAEGRFGEISPEFATVVGPVAADVSGIPFAEVAEAFGFDEDGEIAGLLDRRETWSGRQIQWPVEGTDRKVPIDLAALPTYGRERDFQGFRGFGVVRPAESTQDREAIGLMLLEEDGSGSDDGTPSVEPASQRPSETLAADEGGEPRLSFGQRALPADRTERAGGHAVFRRREALLSPTERDAFKAIGAELSPESSAAVPLVPASPGEAPEPDLDDTVRLALAAVAAPVLVEMAGRLVFANTAFLQFSGYETLATLVERGGLEALFAEGDGADSRDQTLALNLADGRRIEARVQMHRVRFAVRSALLLTFSAASAVRETTLPVPKDHREEVEELRAVLDTATDGIVLLDQGGAIRSLNGSAQSLLGVSTDDARGRHFADFLAPDSRKPAIDYLESLREEGLAGILNDGREVVAEVPGRGPIPLFVTIGRLSEARGWCVVLRDIAHWKRAEAELVAARRQAEDASLHKSRFLANISHELRTPLNAIIGFADVMTAETYGPIGHERYLEYLGDIKRSGHHVLDLVNDLLDISKIEAGKVELAFEAVALNEVVSEVVSLMQPQANRERVIVRSNLPTGVPAVVADRRTLRQIALNLISNAIRFTPAGGQIIASTSYGEDGEVALRFRDSGIGMTDREIEIALTPFRQVNAANKERGDGTGLGLPLTKAMVEANRAQFRIASTPGEGTLIEITFPAQRVLAH